MRPSLIRLAAQRTPLIKFLGKRPPPNSSSIDHTPHLHPADPHPALPDSFADSFANYREQVVKPGAPSSASRSTAPASGGSSEKVAPQPQKAYGQIGGKSGKALGSVAAGEGEFFSRSELPRRFQPPVWEEAEMEAVMSGGASMVGNMNYVGIWK